MLSFAMKNILLLLALVASILSVASAAHDLSETDKIDDLHHTKTRMVAFSGKSSSGKTSAKSSGKTSAKSSGKSGVRAPNPSEQNGSSFLLKAICTNVQVCTDEMITPLDVGFLSYDVDGSLPSISLSQTMGFPVGTTEVTLHVVGKYGQKDSCKALVCALKCQTCSPWIDSPKGPTPTVSSPSMPSPNKSGKSSSGKSSSSAKGKVTSWSGKSGSSKAFTSKAASQNSPLPGGKGKGVISRSPPSVPPPTGGKKAAAKMSKIRTRMLKSKRGKGTVSKNGNPSKLTSPGSDGRGKGGMAEFCFQDRDPSYLVATPTKDCINPPKVACKRCQVCAGDTISVDCVDAGSYDPYDDNARGFLDDYGPFDLADNGKIVTLTVVNEDHIYSTCNANIAVAACAPACSMRIRRFNLIDSLNDVVISTLPLYLKYPEIYLRDFNIVAEVQECHGKRVRSVLWIYNGRTTCSKHGQFSLFGDVQGDFDSYIFPLGGPYNITATPFATKDCTGVAGASLSQVLYALGPDGYMDCPGAPCYFDLYNAESHEYIQAIQDGQKICLPDYDVNFKAAVINCDRGRVRSVKFRISGDRSYESVQSGMYFYVYGALGSAKYSVGKYTITATTYAAINGLGDPASSNNVSFEFIDCHRD